MTIGEFNVLDRRIDKLILTAAGERFLEHTLRPLHTIFRRIGWIHHNHSAGEASVHKTIDCHLAVLNAIANRHVDRAVAASDKLIEFVDSMFDIMEREIDPALLDSSLEPLVLPEALGVEMRIVFHGENAGSFSDGFADRLGLDAEIALLPDVLATDAERLAYASADVIVGTKFERSLPRPEGLKLFHVPGAGYDSVDLDALPPSAIVCNCFGHEQAIAEYVMAALLARHVPLVDADRRLRERDWAYWAGAAERVHDEIAGKTIGLLGFGHIGKAIARRAKAFEMDVARRQPQPGCRLRISVDRSLHARAAGRASGAPPTSSSSRSR